MTPISPRGTIRLGDPSRRWHRPLGAAISPLRRRLRSLVFALIGFLIGCAIFDRLLMPRVVRLGDEVQVPSVAGLDIEEAKRKLEAANLEPVVGSGVHSADLPRGQVLATTPPGGLRVKRNRQVYLSPSLGTEDRRLPELAGQTVRMARVVLQEVGLRLGQVVRARSRDAAPDEILAMSPPAGSAAAGDEAVLVLLASPEQESPYSMPDLRGSDASEAAAWLTSRGFSVTFLGAGIPGRGEFVSAQDPPPGGMVWRGSTVRLGTGEIRPPDGEGGAR